MGLRVGVWAGEGPALPVNHHHHLHVLLLLLLQLVLGVVGLTREGVLGRKVRRRREASCLIQCGDDWGQRVLQKGELMMRMMGGRVVVADAGGWRMVMMMWRLCLWKRGGLKVGGLA
jgi:hypothetical protein